MPTNSNPGLYRIGGMYGAAYRGGVMLSEVVEVTAAVEVNRIEIPLTGSTKQGYKPGRESREGSIRLQKVDTTWELEVFNFLNQSLETRRANRGTPDAVLKPFTLVLSWDDPDALGAEKWQLDGCLIWRMPLGFNITDDIRDLEFPFTWETESPLKAFKRTGQIDPVTGLPAIEYPYDV
jgi:hypothetical protein